MSDNKVILVTGASMGIGAAAAALLAKQGHRVFGTSRRDNEPPAEGVEMLKLDVTDDASVAQCVGEVLERAGGLDVLINNAGYAHRGPLENVTVDEFRAQFETNLYGVHRMVRAVLPGMFAQGSGRIINISSAIGRVAIPLTVTYCSSKFALEGYSEGLAKELKPHGIDVVIMEPGLTATDFHVNATHVAEVAARYKAGKSEQQPDQAARFRGADSAEDVAEVILRCVEDTEPQLRYPAPAAKALLGSQL